LEDRNDGRLDFGAHAVGHEDKPGVETLEGALARFPGGVEHFGNLYMLVARGLLPKSKARIEVLVEVLECGTCLMELALSLHGAEVVQAGGGDIGVDAHLIGRAACESDLDILACQFHLVKRVAG
jgi:hypothetical protein